MCVVARGVGQISLVSTVARGMGIVGILRG